MRKLMWFAIGFTAACVAGAYLLFGVWFLLFGLLCLLSGIVALFVRSKPAKIAAMVLLGSAVGSLWFGLYDGFYLSTAQNYDGETVAITVTASDYSYRPSYGSAFDGYIDLEGKSYRVRCYLNSDISITPGNQIKGDFYLRYMVDNEERTYHQGKGIFLLAYQEGEVLVSEGELQFRDYPAIWRRKIQNAIESVFPVDTAGFAKALLIGDTMDLTYQQDRAFQVSGIRHIVAVSGLHISILFALIYMVFGRQRVLNAVFGIPLLLIFAAITGFSPSMIRACTMQILMLLALLVDKEYDSPTALAFAVLVILGINPRTITAVGFQLSVGCMVGIFAFSEPLRQYMLSFGKLKSKSKGKTLSAKLIRWLTGSVSVSLSAMVVTTPLCAIYFEMISLVGVLTNLLTLWIISTIFYGIMIACVVAAVWLPFGKCVGWLISWLVRYVFGISELLADFPLAAVYTDSVYIVFWLVFSYLLLALFFLMKKKNPSIVILSIILGLCVCVSLSWIEPRLDDTRVSVIDVGQGQSVYIQQGDARFLVDCGGEHTDITADTVANFLLSQGVFHLDGVILTHYDADHAGSVLNLLTSIDADRIYMPDLSDSNGIRQQIEATYRNKVQLISGITELPVNTGKFTLYPTESAANDNDSSVCVLFQVENCDILITGDRSAAGERELLRHTQLPALELLVVGHHGSNESTSLELLYATFPKIAVISVGENNRYGHPRPEVLDRLARFGCEVYRTDKQGTIIFRR